MGIGVRWRPWSGSRWEQGPDAELGGGTREKQGLDGRPDGGVRQGSQMGQMETRVYTVKSTFPLYYIYRW